MKQSGIKSIKSVSSFRTINPHLGTGYSSTVSLVEYPLTRERFALKSVVLTQIDKTKLKQKELKYIEQEIEIHSVLEHPNVIKLFKVLREGHFIHLVLEYASKGSLFDYMQRQRHLKDEQIAFVFDGICKGIQYIHGLSILHRDLKPENVLFDDSYTPKLADFGFACRIRKNEPRRTICGTREYFSPEIFTYKNQSLALDVWCLGILLYELCHNRVPFKMNSFSFKEAAEQIRKQQYR